jgi:predicted transposase YdaD
MVEDAKQAHDALFKATFTDVARAAAELRAVLPEALVARIDFSTLQLVSGTFVDERLRGTQSDLLFEVAVAGKPGFIYLLFEHQSRSDPLMGLRLLSYVVHILERHVSGGHGLPLPLVVPVVLHHGGTGWTAARCVEELFEPALAGVPELMPYLPRLSFIVDDLAKVSNANILARNLDDFAALVLWALRDSRGPQRLLTALKFWAAALGRLGQRDAAALEQIFRYLLLVTPDLELDVILQVLRDEVPSNEQPMTTIAEKLRAEGEARGRAEGEARGRAEGEADGVRRTLLRLLTLKFGTLPQAAAMRLAAATEPELQLWTERVLVAESLAGVLDG